MSAMDVEIPAATLVHPPTTDTASATVEGAASMSALAAGDAPGIDPAHQGDTAPLQLGSTATIEQATPAVSTATTPAANDGDAAQGDGSNEDTDGTKSDTDDHDDDEDESESDNEAEDEEEGDSEEGSDNEDDDDQRSTMSIDEPPSIAAPPPAPIIPFPRPLPSDLIKPICVHLCDKDIKTLLAVQASCQAGWDAATPLLYRSVALNSERAWRSFFAPWEVKVKVKDKEAEGHGGAEKKDEKVKEGADAAVGNVEGDAGKESEIAPADGGEIQGAVVADTAALAMDVVLAADTTTTAVNTAKTTTGGDMTANTDATVVEGPTTSAAINGSSTHTPSQTSTSPASHTDFANAAPDTHLSSGLSTGPPELVCRFEKIRGDAETSTQSSSNSASEKDDDEYYPLTASQLRARKAMGAIREFKFGFLPSCEAQDWMAAAMEQNEYRHNVDLHALLLPNVKSVMFGPKMFCVYDRAFRAGMHPTFADLCQPTSFCIDFGDQHFGEDSGNYDATGVVNQSSQDEIILDCVRHWRKLTHVNIHSTAACYPISTYFPGIHTNMYVTPPNHRSTIKGDDGYAIAMQLVKLIVGYITDDATEDEKAETKWELAFIDKFVHPDVLGTDHHDVPFMAYMRGDLAWDASDKLEDKIKVARASGSISADKADHWRDRLDRFFEGETLKFWEERGMDKCVACGRNDE